MFGGRGLNAVFIFCLLLAQGTLAYGEVDFKIGGDFRFRTTYFKNIYTYDTDKKKDIRHYWRQRQRIWGRWNVDDSLSFYVRLTNEFYAYYTPSEPFEINEVVFDNLYCDVKNVFDLPVSLRIGRQDLKYADGFIVWEGTPKDGTRTSYFDAIKLSWDINEKNSFDLVFIKNDQKDQKLPRINDLSDEKPRGDYNLVKGRSVNASDETGVVGYLKSDISERMHTEAFYIYKDAAPITSKNIPERKINAFGGFMKYRFNDSLSLRGLVTYETGDYGPYDLGAWAAYMFLDASHKDLLWQPVFTAGYLYASGDDPDTSKNEEFDPLFGRYVFPSTPYYYVCLAEGEPYLGSWNNIHFFMFKVLLKPLSRMKTGFEFDYVRAPERGGGSIHSSGKTKAYIPSMFVSYDLAKNVNVKFTFFYVIPGSYYVSTADDAFFTRLQMLVKY